LLHHLQQLPAFYGSLDLDHDLPMAGNPNGKKAESWFQLLD
jgi:hypothetical protein